MKKLVSIITPCYNGEKYLHRFLDSIYAQTYRPMELIFVDDGSEDNTKAIFDSYVNKFEVSDISIVYIYQENAGQAAAINAALPRFKGEYMMWVDSDDILDSSNIEEKVNYLEEHSTCGFVLCQGNVVRADNVELIRGLLMRKHKANDSRYSLFKDLIDETNVVYVPATIMVRKNAIIESIPSLKIYEGRQGQNWQLMLPLSYMFDHGFIDKPLFSYVVHEDSHSHEKRSYEQLISRAEEFDKLITFTINAIPSMPTDDKKEWIRYVHEKYARVKLQIAYINLNKTDARKFKVELKKYTQLKLIDNFYYYKLRCWGSKIKVKVKKRIKK